MGFTATFMRSISGSCTISHKRAKDIRQCASSIRHKTASVGNLPAAALKCWKSDQSTYCTAIILNVHQVGGLLATHRTKRRCERLAHTRGRRLGLRLERLERLAHHALCSAAHAD